MSNPNPQSNPNQGSQRPQSGSQNPQSGKQGQKPERDDSRRSQGREEENRSNKKTGSDY